MRWRRKRDGRVRAALLTLVLCGGALPCFGCSIRQLALDGLGSALSSVSDSFASEEDPELVRDALPFALKTMEGVLLEDPTNQDLLLAACSGYTQYAYAFLEGDALLIEDVDYERSEILKERALRLYLRARGYGLRALDLRHQGVSDELRSDPEAAAARLEAGDLELVYWTAAAWGLAISLGQDRPEVVADVDAVRVLLKRALELDETYDQGAIHVALITIEALPEMMGGSPERARSHFARSIELSGGVLAGPYVTLAESVSVPAQDREEFEDLLGTALEIDPELAPRSRLANELARARAQHLLNTADELFLEPLE